MEEKKEIFREGELDLNGLIIPCYVLQTGERVLSTIGMQKALGVMGNEPTQRSSGRLEEILSSKAVSRFISTESESSKYSPMICYKGNQKISAYDATLLPEICEIMLKVRDYAQETGQELGNRQKAVIVQADVMVRALARVGIIALVDEATGYQYERERFELQKILAVYISDEILKWQLTFTDDFYKEVYRLWGLPFIPKYIKNKPQFIGKLTNTYIYEQLPNGVLEKIKEITPKTPKGHWKYKFHQSLKPDVGREHLKKQIIEVTTLMSISKTKDQFQKLFKQKYGDDPQLELEFKEPPPKPPTRTGFDATLIRALNYNPKEKPSE